MHDLKGARFYLNSEEMGMQRKIESFFEKSVPISSVCPITAFDDELAVWESKHHCVDKTFERRVGKSAAYGATEIITESSSEKSVCIGNCSTPERLLRGSKDLNRSKKRSYSQFHLEFGQSDFLMRTCLECGMKYSPGDEGDENAHMEFHKSYTHGFRFKGWRHEKIVNEQKSDDYGRIVLVQDCDPPAQRNKVKGVVKMMEIDLGCGWIYHKLCKVYLFVSARRIVGCLVAEPIKEAFRIVSSLEKEKNNGLTKKEAKTRVEPSPLRFGNVVLQRELVKDSSVKKNQVSDGKPNGAIFCEEKAVPATCGIRAIWVTPSNRRKRIATRLLDAARFSFGGNGMLDRCQMAFSQPTALGKALAFGYLGDNHLLVYKADEDRRQFR